ncbi:MAG TPA: aspartate aminotransferase family protein [Phycisphaerae bacterium]|nr:aspartate aminotransferase family protein [Phycisphaerae bacterium]
MTVIQNTRGSNSFDPAHNTAKSKQWFARAQSVLAGGISSSARSVTTGELPYPLYMDHGCGSHITDVDGNTFIDYLLSYGSLILGHAPEVVTTAVCDQMAQGSMFGTCNTVEVGLARLICESVPCADLVRYANSGSEAICGAIRAARGFTGRSRVLKFEGHYHGWVDVLAVSNRPNAFQTGALTNPSSHPHSRGIPAGVVEDVVICPWNHPEILLSILDKYEGQFAAIIAEPIVANNACTMPDPGFLELLRNEATRRGIILIFDEIVTGFRLSIGGAQQHFGVTPDIAVFSKALGGGTPLSAFAGKAEVMNLVASNQIKHGGTYNGNPMCAAAGRAVIEALLSENLLERMEARGQHLMEAIRRAASDFCVPCIVQGTGTMFQVVFTPDGRPIRHYRDLLSADTDSYARFRQGLLLRGIHANSSGSACWFLSSAHTDDDIAYTAEMIHAAMGDLR